jgi:hypothetical protein
LQLIDTSLEAQNCDYDFPDAATYTPAVPWSQTLFDSEGKEFRRVMPRLGGHRGRPAPGGSGDSQYSQRLENLREIKRQNRIQPHFGDDHFIAIGVERNSVRFLHDVAWFSFDRQTRRKVAVVVDALGPDASPYRLRDLA